MVHKRGFTVIDVSDDADISYFFMRTTDLKDFRGGRKVSSVGLRWRSYLSFFLWSTVKNLSLPTPQERFDLDDFGVSGWSQQYGGVFWHAVLRVPCDGYATMGGIEYFFNFKKRRRC